MATRHHTRARTALAAALFTALLAACGGDDPAKLIASAQEYLAKDNYSAAVIQLKNALQKEPNNGQARFLLGKAQYDSGDMVGAESELKRALEAGQSPDAVLPMLGRASIAMGNADAFLKTHADRKLGTPAAQGALLAVVGDAYVRLGNRDKAADAYARALQANPADPRAKLGQAQLLSIDGKADEALALVDGVVAANPKHAEALTLRGELMLARGDRDGARKSFVAASEADPRFTAARLALAAMQIDDQQYGDAEQSLQAARKAAPGDARVIYFEALLGFRKNDIQKARDNLALLLKGDPNFVPALVLAGAVELQANQPTTALSHLERAVARAPGHNGARRLLATAYLRSNQAAKAKEVLAPMLAKGEVSDSQLLLLAGEANLAAGDLKQATTFFQTAATQDKGEGGNAARLRLGELALASGDTESGIRQLEEASKADPTNTNADVALVTSLMRKREFDKALTAANNFLAKAPKNPMAHQAVGMALGGKRDMAGARKSFEQALALDSKYTPAAHALAQLDIVENKPAAAAARYEALIAKEPKSESLYLALAEVQRRSGAQPSEIEQTLRRSVQANPGSVDARAALVRYFLSERNPKAAIQAGQEAVAAVPNNTRLLLALATAQEQGGEANTAIETIRKAVQTAPTQPMPWLQLAGLHIRAKDYEKAVDALRSAGKIQPDNTAIPRDIVVAYAAGGMYDKAASEAQALQRARPKDALGFVLEGEVLEVQDKMADAEQRYREALKADPASSVAALKLHATLVALKKDADAEAFARKWITDNPRDVGMLMRVAEGNMRSKNYKAAVAQYQGVLAVNPDNGVALNNLAWALGELNDKQSLQYAQRALELAPQNAAVLDTMGILLARFGDAQRAVEFHERATRAAPDRADLRLHYAKALIKTGNKVAAKAELEALQSTAGDFPGRAEIPALLKTL